MESRWVTLYSNPPTITDFIFTEQAARRRQEWCKQNIIQSVIKGCECII